MFKIELQQNWLKWKYFFSAERKMCASSIVEEGLCSQLLNKLVNKNSE